MKLAVVERLIVGLDGHVRAADIRTASGKTNRSIARYKKQKVKSREM